MTESGNKRNVSQLNNISQPSTKKIKLTTDINESKSDINNNDNNNDNNKSLKRRVALIVGYVGDKYHGSSFIENDNLPTIMKELFDAIVKTGAIDNKNIDNYRKNGMNGSSRTDKGVHAAAALFSIKMRNFYEEKLKECLFFFNFGNLKVNKGTNKNKNRKKNKQKNKRKNKDNIKGNTDDTGNNGNGGNGGNGGGNGGVNAQLKLYNELKDDNNYVNFETRDIVFNGKVMSDDEIGIHRSKLCEWDKMCNDINKYLPNDIRVLGIQRVTKKFEPRYSASSRIYHYICPSYLFDPDMSSNQLTDIIDMKRFNKIMNTRKQKREQHKKLKVKDGNDVDNVKQQHNELDNMVQIKDDSKNNNAGGNDPRIGFRLSKDKLGLLCIC